MYVAAGTAYGGVGLPSAVGCLENIGKVALGQESLPACRLPYP
jgi:hypothetical protein